MQDPDGISSDSNPNITKDEKRRSMRKSSYTVKLLNREAMDQSGKMIKLSKLKVRASFFIINLVIKFRLTLTCTIDLPPHTPVALKIADQR